MPLYESAGTWNCEESEHETTHKHLLKPPPHLQPLAAILLVPVEPELVSPGSGGLVPTSTVSPSSSAACLTPHLFQTRPGPGGKMYHRWEEVAQLSEEPWHL